MPTSPTYVWDNEDILGAQPGVNCPGFALAGCASHLSTAEHRLRLVPAASGRDASMGFGRSSPHGLLTGQENRQVRSSGLIPTPSPEPDFLRCTTSVSVRSLTTVSFRQRNPPHSAKPCHRPAVDILCPLDAGAQISLTNASLWHIRPKSLTRAIPATDRHYANTTAQFYFILFYFLLRNEDVNAAFPTATSVCMDVLGLPSHPDESLWPVADQTGNVCRPGFVGGHSCLLSRVAVISL